MLYTCPHCKNPLPADAVFCGACGKRVTNISTATENVTTTTSASSFPPVPSLSSLQEDYPPHTTSYGMNTASYTAEPTPAALPKQLYTPAGGTVQPEAPTYTPYTHFAAEVQASPSAQTEEETLTATQYFLMMMAGAIPVLGWLYLLLVAINAKAEARRHFAAGMLLFIPVFCLSAILFAKAFLQGLF